MKFTIAAIVAVFAGLAVAGGSPPPPPAPPAPAQPNQNEQMCDCAKAERRWLSARSVDCCANEVREKRTADAPEIEFYEDEEAGDY